jgi:hypothetical protein
MSGKRVLTRNDWPFPQADRVERLFGVVEMVCHGPVDDTGIAAAYDIDPRQGAYYSNAAAFLGFITNRGGLWRPTADGQALNAADDETRCRRIGEKILDKAVFREAAVHLAAYGELPPVEEIMDWVRADDRKLNSVTAERRAQTVHSWVSAVAEAAPDMIAALGEEAMPAARFG